ncbi:MAG TPA: Gfo/Idh/MocA family oxidoreductase [Candidatus Methylacidiphilales bacterium]|nr:Gfo/Idh/MocA family oxidoreductase [Candidatus Methylacidiphilales bacterium]
MNIGIIGIGRWGRNYLRVFSNLPGVKLTAVCDADATRAADAAQSCPQVKVFSDVGEMLASGCCEAVVVATEASAHYAICKQCLEKKMAVLIEKPLTTREEEGRELTELAERQGVILMVAHTFLFNPAVRRLKQLLNEKAPGDIYFIKARRTHLGPIRGDVNVVWDLAPHDLSMMFYLLDERPAEIQAMGASFLKPSVEDVAFVNLRFPSGVVGNIILSWADSNKERYLDVVGSRARIAFNDLSNLEPIRIFYKGVALKEERARNFGEFQFVLRDGDIVSPQIDMAEPLRVLCEEFVQAVQTGTKPYSDGRFGTDIVAACRKIEELLKRK